MIVWCGVANFGVISPYFFKEEDGRADAVTSARYVEMLWNVLTPELMGVQLQSHLLVMLKCYGTSSHQN
jgi:hypothetical protein